LILKDDDLEPDVTAGDEEGNAGDTDQGEDWGQPNPGGTYVESRSSQ
jgi:hypothetical protein